MSHSTPVKDGVTQSKGKSASQASSELLKYKVISEVSEEQFLARYLSGQANYDPSQLAGREKAIGQIQSTKEGKEKSLYTKRAPLLRLLNGLSKLVHDSLPDAQTHNGLVFRAGNSNSIRHPFHNSLLLPDVVALWEPVGVLSKLTSNGKPNFDSPSNQTWSNLVTVGEVKVNRKADGQIGNYLRNLLQLHPENSGVFGFSARIQGYQLLYHDAAVIQKSQEYAWSDLRLLLKFIEKLYSKPFRDPSMYVFQPENPLPIWVVKANDYTLLSHDGPPENEPRAEQGPGQRRLTGLMTDAGTEKRWFMKEYWRDTQRRFFEWVLYQAAHKGKNIPGLMYPEFGGHVLNSDGNKMKTTDLETSIIREKVRVITRDVGVPLDKITSLRQFLCVMYDACVVQRNLYRKAKILHRDISDSNIMAAPIDNAMFYSRCAEGYDEVKYLNQVLAKDKKVKPKPACLVIDLGNGADLTTDEGTAEVLTTRTGTPKFIARSVSSGEVLIGSTPKNLMPKLEGRALELYEFMDETQHGQFNRAIDDAPLLDEESLNLQSRHQLYHDAESVFWVIAWTLARSTRSTYEAETQATGSSLLSHK
ncbi:hypothetical protein CTheo_8642 [Ceratobasidium theobromae]|uniref:Fungal-type protein kinase domain-containing protein n=1 Tax=Ceratobasidium theobromae TaxID=1582974 RepID=A0A5N5Q868_9AGAM|nr:hypothetical protein CTheo_8642 [Ceratobasidium theobromae]